MPRWFSKLNDKIVSQGRAECPPFLFSMNTTVINIGGRLLALGGGRRLVMAIVNVTPDSFFAGSRRQSDAEIAQAVETAVREGAAIIDLGGYSSRPGAEDIAPDEELRRLENGFRIVREVAGADFPVSVDTFRSGVVLGLYEGFGAFMVNDISAGELDAGMIPLVGRLGLPYIAMHMRGTPQTMNSLTDYSALPGGVTGEVLRFFVRKAAQAREAGIRDLILDPGFGFAKTVAQNFELLGRMDELGVFGLPLLAGLSRKSLIWRTLGVTPGEALNGTSVLNWEALRRGAAILRVHDVREAAEAVRLFEACVGC